MRRGGSYLLVYVILGVLFFGGVPSFAQKTTGDITGAVTDASGGVVPNASIKAENKATGATRTATTSTSGEYRLAEMQLGTYKVTVSVQGFKTAVGEVQVAIGIVTTANFQLQVGEKAETVVVEATTPLIELTDKLNSYVDEERIKDLPLSGRDFNSLLTITPGVQRAPGGGFLAVNITGARRSTNNYLIDGVSNNDRYYGDSLIGQTGVVGIPATYIAIDAIQEFSVQQNPSAEYGVKGGAAINVAVKSGTNNLHGSAYYFGHAEFTDASNFFTQTVTPVKNHQFGGTIGGPIVKDKTFFFGYYEGQRNKSLSAYTLTGVPTPQDKQQALANIAGAGLSPFPGGQFLFDLVPTTPTGDLTVAIPNTASGNTFLIKIDHKLAEGHQLTGRYFFGDSFQSAPQFGYALPPSPGNPQDLYNSIAPSRAQLLGLNWTYTMSPTKILETRFGWSRFSQILEPNNKVNPASLGIDTGPLDPADFGIPYVYFYSFSAYMGGVGGYPISTRPDANYEIAQNLTWIKGKHTMKMGGDWHYAYTDSLRNRARTIFNVAGFGDTLQNPNDPNSPVIRNANVNALIQLLLLRFDNANRNFGNTQRHLTEHSWGAYFNDEWKVTPRLTLTMGLRWDFNTPIGESSKLGSTFIPGQGLVSLSPNFTRLYDSDFNNFGPRAGLAWDIFGNGKTALRLGYSLTYDSLILAEVAAPRVVWANGSRAGAFNQIPEGNFSVFLTGDLGNEPLSGSCFDFSTQTGNYICGGPNKPIYGPNPTSQPPFNAFGIKQDLGTPMIHYYTASIQQQLFRNTAVTVSYVGSQGRDLTMFRDLNARRLGCWDAVNDVQLTTGNCARPFDSFRVPCASDPVNGCPEFLSIVQLTDDGKSWYHSLQASLRQQNWHGINAQYNLTWSRCIDYASVERGSGSGVNTSPAQNPWIPSANRGPCDHDVNLNFNIGGTYALPKFASLGRFGEGWEIGSLLNTFTGRPFPARISASHDNSGQDVNGNLHGDCPVAPIYNTRDPANYIANLSAFVTATRNHPPNTLGTCGRNSFRGPGFAQWDMGLTKMTRITERLQFQFRWEVFNVLNRANYNISPFTTNLRSSSFGTFNQTPDAATGNPVIGQGGPRGMQFVGKFIF